jgi:hypothetical protein
MTRPPLPPFTDDTAAQKARLAETAGEGGSAGNDQPSQCVPGSPGTGSVPITVNGDGIWAAWQDGDGLWLPLEKSDQKFTFRPSGTRYAVAVAAQRGTVSWSSPPGA